jgi:hypothetical protein
MPTRSFLSKALMPIDFETVQPGMKLLLQYQPAPGLVVRGEGYSPHIVEAIFPDTRRLRVRWVTKTREQVYIIGWKDGGWYHIHTKRGTQIPMVGVYKLEGTRLKDFDEVLRSK